MNAEWTAGWKADGWVAKWMITSERDPRRDGGVSQVWSWPRRIAIKKSLATARKKINISNTERSAFNKTFDLQTQQHNLFYNIKYVVKV